MARRRLTEFSEIVKAFKDGTTLYTGGNNPHFYIGDLELGSYEEDSQFWIEEESELDKVYEIVKTGWVTDGETLCFVVKVDCDNRMVAIDNGRSLQFSNIVTEYKSTTPDQFIKEQFNR